MANKWNKVMAHNASPVWLLSFSMIAPLTVICKFYEHWWLWYMSIFVSICVQEEENSPHLLETENIYHSSLLSWQGWIGYQWSSGEVNLCNFKICIKLRFILLQFTSQRFWFWRWYWAWGFHFSCDLIKILQWISKKHLIAFGDDHINDLDADDIAWNRSDKM